MATRDGSEGEDQGHEPGAGDHGVDEQLEARLAGREPLRRDTGADDDRDEERGAEAFRGQPARELAIQPARQQHRVADSGADAQHAASAAGSTLRSGPGAISTSSRTV